MSDLKKCRPSFCKHYRAMSEHKTCEAGVEYSIFNGTPRDHHPCFPRRGKPNPTGCDKADYPTVEDVARWDAYISERFGKTGKAREAIVTHLGGPWKKGIGPGQGIIDCPACGGTECLSFSRSSYNGHIHARCATDGCVSWME